MSENMPTAYAKSLQNPRQGSYRSADEAHEAYKAAHLDHFGSASPWATGGASMSNANDSYSAPTESFFRENRDTAGATL